MANPVRQAPRVSPAPSAGNADAEVALQSCGDLRAPEGPADWRRPGRTYSGGDGHVAVRNGQAVRRVVSAPAPAGNKDLCPCMQVPPPEIGIPLLIAADKAGPETKDAAGIHKEDCEVPARPSPVSQGHFRGLRVALLTDCYFTHLRDAPVESGQKGEDTSTHLVCDGVRETRDVLIHAIPAAVGLEREAKVVRELRRQPVGGLITDEVVEGILAERLDLRTRDNSQRFGQAVEPGVGDTIPLEIQAFAESSGLRFDPEVEPDQSLRPVAPRPESKDMRFQEDRPAEGVRGSVRDLEEHGAESPVGFSQKISPPRPQRLQRLARSHQESRTSGVKSPGLFSRAVVHSRLKFKEFLCGLCALCG